MTGESGQPVNEYVEAAVQRLLTEHAQIAEQGITISRRDHGLLLCGEVASPQRRDEILRLVTENFPDVALSVDIGVISAPEPTEAEELP
ncbi:MAG: hypothetical protein DIU79_00970 [Actinobacteria bacterium]|nr:MAG: hypothetical protein DIU79_00970 [Actinomycetota bacterium]